MQYIVITIPGRDISKLKEQIPNLIVSEDQEKNPLKNYVSGLSFTDEPCVMLEDDIELCDNFVERIEKEIAKNPNEVISFFSLKHSVKETKIMKSKDFCMNQCVYFPENLAQELAEYEKEWPRKAEHPTGNDFMLADFLVTKKRDYILSIPNLVQHLEGVSAINPSRSSKRQSKIYQKEEVKSIVGIPDLWEIKTIKVSELKLNEDNPRTITAKNLAKLKESLKKRGNFKTLTANMDGVVLGGNQRLLTLQSMGIEETEIKMAKVQFTKKQEAEIVILDNEGYGEYDEEMKWQMIEDNDMDIEELTNMDLGDNPNNDYQPNTNPEFSNNEITDEDMEKKKDQLDNQMTKNFEDNIKGGQSVLCPNCGEEINFNA